MANPNIVNVTSIYGESLGQALTTSVDAVVMTVASNKLLKINYIQSYLNRILLPEKGLTFY